MSPIAARELQQPTFYVTVEVRVIADTEDEAKSLVTLQLAPAPSIYGFVVGDVERGGLI